MSKKVALHNLGCKVNAYETEAMGQTLLKSGYELVDFNQEADIYIINTCSVTNIADRKSRQMLHRARKKNPHAIVVAAGCYVQTAGAEVVLEDGTVDLVIGNNKKQDIVRILENYEADHRNNKEIIDIGKTDAYEEMELETVTEHTRAYIKVQDGCNQFCSYCIIPYARGRIRSRKQADVKNEVIRLVKEGYQEIVLTGIHLSSYGLERKEAGESLISLIEAVSSVAGVKRIRLGSLEPRIITREFMERLVQIPQICPHFHLSLQSGCDTVLKRMNRKYTTEEYKTSCDIIRSFYEKAAITTDIIVGFPQETEEEFETTAQYVETIRFADVHIFPYSVRQGTVAAGMSGQVDGNQKHDRAKRLEAVCEKQTKAYREQFINTLQEVLFEQQEILSGETYMTGYTKEYVKVAVKTEADFSNQMGQVLINERLNPEIMLALLEKLY
jgi:threonylcarbamoyladenosine tRNA methylthiotransferase MtaB